MYFALLRHAGALLFAAPLFLVGCWQPAAWQFDGAAMGTGYKVRVGAAPSGKLVRARTEEGVALLLEQLEALLSHYREDSEVSVFNALEAPGAMPVSEHTARVVATALTVAQLSNGAFDITIAPLVELWGFGASPAKDTPPEPQRIAQLRTQIGSDCLVLLYKPPRLKKTRPCRIDFSALAKGYAVDQVAEYLQQQGISNYLVELGGEVRVHGGPTPDRPWRVGIESPNPAPHRSQHILRLQDGAVATSGDYRNYFLHQGQRYSHTLDPTTGFPITHPLASVTVIAPTALNADALATALNVLGPTRGCALATRQNIAAYFLVRHGDQLQAFHSPAFEAYGEGAGSSACASIVGSGE